MKIINLVFSAFVCVSLIGCAQISKSTPYKPRVIEPSNASFYGLHPSSTGNKVTNLVMIHGMCHHTTYWIDEMRNSLADHFGMKSDKVDPFYDATGTGVSVFKTRIFNSNEVINIYGILYSEATKPIKQEYLCQDVRTPSIVCPNASYNRVRAKFNEFGKDIFLNDCLADAVIYIGDTGKSIRKGVKQSIIKIQDDIHSSGPLFFLSESLGSKVLRDTILCKDDDDAKTILSFVASSTVIFLGANQIALLNTGNLSECGVPAALKNTFTKSNEKMSGGFEDILKLIKLQKSNKINLYSLPSITPKVISFTDPNDLLSYEITTQYGDNDVVNVIVSNDYTWKVSSSFIVKFNLEAENPYTAHLGYRDNEDVINLIKCGYKNENVQTCMSK